MYGIKSHQSSEALKDKLDQLKSGNKKIEAVQAKCEEIDRKLQENVVAVNRLLEENNLINKMYTDLREKCASTADSVKTVETFLYGNEEESEEGFVEQTKHAINSTRDEYTELISSYVEMATPRQDRSLIENIEKRLTKLEERPRVQLREARSIGAESRSIPNFEKAAKK